MKLYVDEWKRKMRVMAMLLLSLVLLAACDDDDDFDLDDDELTIPELAEDTENLSDFARALEVAGLEQTLEGTGPFTVFAPTNDAWDDYLGGQDFTDLDNDDLRDRLLYHVIDGELSSDELTEGILTTRSGEDLFVVKDGNDIFLNGTRVITTNLNAENGIIHIVNEVLDPDDPGDGLGEPGQSMYDLLTNEAYEDTFSTFLEALDRQGLERDYIQILEDENSDYTYFIPTNAAFDSFFANSTYNSLDDIPLLVLEKIIDYHIVIDAKMVDDLSQGDQLPTILQYGIGETFFVYVTGDNGTIILNDSISVTTPNDLEAETAVAHAIDGVLAPSDFVENGLINVLARNASYSRLIALLQENEFTAYRDRLTDPDEDITFFAPTNEAFDSLESRLGVDLNDAPDTLIMDILDYHFVQGARTSSDLIQETQLSSDYDNESINVTDRNGDLVLNEGNYEAVISGPDQTGYNGVAHGIDQVLLPGYVQSEVDP